MMIKVVGPGVKDVNFLQVARTFRQMKQEKINYYAHVWLGVSIISCQYNNK